RRPVDEGTLGRRHQAAACRTEGQNLLAQAGIEVSLSHLSMERRQAQISGERLYAPSVGSARSGRAIVGLAIGGSLLLAACGRNTGAGQAPTARPSVHVASALIGSHPIPAWDL